MKHIQLFENFSGATTLKPADITRPGDVLVLFTSGYNPNDDFVVALMSQTQYIEFKDLLEIQKKIPPLTREVYRHPDWDVYCVYEKPGAAYVYFNLNLYSNGGIKNNIQNGHLLGKGTLEKGDFWEIKDASFEKNTSDVLYWGKVNKINWVNKGRADQWNNPMNPSLNVDIYTTPEPDRDIVFQLKRGWAIEAQMGFGDLVSPLTVKKILDDLISSISREFFTFYKVKEEEIRKAEEKWLKNPPERIKKQRDFRDNSGWKEIEMEINNFQQKYIDDWRKIHKLPSQQRNQIRKQRVAEFNTLLQKAKNILKEWENRLDSEYYNSVLLPTLDKYQLYFYATEEGVRQKEREEYDKNPRSYAYFMKNSGWKEMGMEINDLWQRIMHEWKKIHELPDQQKKQIMKQWIKELSPLLQKGKNILKEWENRETDGVWFNELSDVLEDYQKRYLDRWKEEVYLGRINYN